MPLIIGGFKRIDNVAKYAQTRAQIWQWWAKDDQGETEDRTPLVLYNSCRPGHERIKAKLAIQAWRVRSEAYPRLRLRGWW